MFTVHRNKKIAYSRSGSGFPLVFIHGFCEDRSMWNDFTIPFLKQYSIITIDVGGFGHSELPETASIQAMAEQVEAVLQTENIQECVLIGHSMGGYIATAFAEFYPQYLKGIVMFHTHPFADTVEKKDIRDKGKAFIEEYGVEKFVTPLIPRLFSNHYRDELRPIIHQLIETAQNYSSEAVIGGLVAMKNRPNRAAILEKTTFPVQFIIGKLDSAVTWEQSLQQTSLPNISDIQVLNDVGHMGMFEATEQTQQMILGFISFCLADRVSDQ